MVKKSTDRNLWGRNNKAAKVHKGLYSQRKKNICETQKLFK
jgi:hypothetical protein